MPLEAIRKAALPNFLQRVRIMWLMSELFISGSYMQLPSEKYATSIKVIFLCNVK